MTFVYSSAHAIPAKRVWQVGASVLLMHLALLWVMQADLASTPSAEDGSQVVMATAVSDTPQPESKREQIKTPQKQAAVVNEHTPSPLDPAVSDAAANAAPATTSAHSSAPNVVLPSASAEYLRNPAPIYPRVSRRLKEQGTVILRVLITLQGTAEKIEIHTSSTHPLLDQAALDAVQSWRFVPGRRNGTAEAMWFTIPVRFILE